MNAEEVFFDLAKRLETADYDAFLAAWLDAFTDDGIWTNTGFPDTKGKAEQAGLMDALHAQIGVCGIRFEMVAYGCRGNAFVSERVDHLLGADGEPVASIPLMGTVEVDGDGKITAWRDYLDPRPYLPPA